MEKEKKQPDESRRMTRTESRRESQTVSRSNTPCHPSTLEMGHSESGDGESEAFASRKSPVQGHSGQSSSELANNSSESNRRSSQQSKNARPTMHDHPGIPKHMCPHCRKEFSNSWAVPPHVMVGLWKHSVQSGICFSSNRWIIFFC